MMVTERNSFSSIDSTETRQELSIERSSSDKDLLIESALEKIVKRGLKDSHLKNKDVLTPEDKELLLINSERLCFDEGEVVFHTDSIQDDNNVSHWWIIGGSIKLSHHQGLNLNIPTGTILSISKRLRSTGIASGKLIVCELNRDYVIRLLENDEGLAFRFYRRLAMNYSSLLRNMVERHFNIEDIEVKPVTPRKRASSPSESRACTPAPRIRSKSTGQVFSCINGTEHFKCHVKNTKLKLIYNTFGLKTKKRYRYTEIDSIYRSSEDSITFTTKAKKGKTLFLKSELDTTHLFDLLSNILNRSPVSVPTSSSPSRLSVYSHDSSSSSGTDSSDSSIDEFMGLISYDENIISGDRKLLDSISQEVRFKKGEHIIQEGDLYQRLYQVESGTIDFLTPDGELRVKKQGDSFGETSLLQLRPWSLNVVASSDEVVMKMVTGAKVSELVHSNSSFGARVYRQLARMTEKKIFGFLMMIEQTQSN